MSIPVERELPLTHEQRIAKIAVRMLRTNSFIAQSLDEVDAVQLLHSEHVSDRQKQVIQDTNGNLVSITATVTAIQQYEDSAIGFYADKRIIHIAGTIWRYA